MQGKSNEEIQEITRKKLKKAVLEAKEAKNEHMVKILEKYDFNMKKNKAAGNDFAINEDNNLGHS